MRACVRVCVCVCVSLFLNVCWVWSRAMTHWQLGSDLHLPLPLFLLLSNSFFPVSAAQSSFLCTGWPLFLSVGGSDAHTRAHTHSHIHSLSGNARVCWPSLTEVCKKREKKKKVFFVFLCVGVYPIIQMLKSSHGNLLINWFAWDTVLCYTNSWCTVHIFMSWSHHWMHEKEWNVNQPQD